MSRKVYLSPAYHRQNNCSISGCFEVLHNNLYLDELVRFLDACGIEWKRGPRRTPMDDEDGTALMKQAVAESNKWGADVHYVSHTNASSYGIGNGTARGCRPIYYKGSERGKKLGEIMVKYRKEVYPFPDKVILNERENLYELRVPYAVSFYEEHVFHDNPEDAQWFHEHMEDVARSAAKGLCEWFGIEYKEPPKKEEPSTTIYRVQVGAFRSKENAQAYLEKVQAAGFPNAYIKEGT